MACENISRGRALGCKKGFSGFKAAGFMNYQELTLGTNGMYDGAGMTASDVFRWELKNDGNNLEQDTVADRQTGTNVTTQTINFVIPGLDKATQDEVKLMSYGRPILFMEMYNGDILVCGFEHGCELTSAKTSVAGERTGLSGFTLAFEAIERNPAVFLSSAGITAYKAAIDVTDQIIP